MVPMPFIYPVTRTSANVLIVRGVFSLLFGIFAFVWPGVTLLTVALLYGVYALVDGAMALASGMRSGFRHRPWGIAVFEGVLGIVAGVVTLFWPGITVFVLAMLVGVWAISTGVTELYAAIRTPRIMNRGVGSRIFLGFAGAVSLVLGIAIFARPAVGVVTLITFISIYSFAFGILFLGLGVQARRIAHETPVEEELPKAA